MLLSKNKTKVRNFATSDKETRMVKSADHVFKLNIIFVIIKHSDQQGRRSHEIFVYFSYAEAIRTTVA